MSCFVTRMVSLSVFPEVRSLWTLTLSSVLWLESLELRGCGFTPDCQINWILRHSPILRSLKFDDCAIVHRLVLWPTRLTGLLRMLVLDAPEHTTGTSKAAETNLGRFQS